MYDLIPSSCTSHHNQFVFTYSAVDGVPNAERLQSVKLNNAAGQTFEELDYTYYKKDDKFGAAGDLKTAADFRNETPGIASGLVQTDGSYYRYVEAPGSTTFGPVNVDPGQTPPTAPLPGLISYVVTGDQFALLASAEGLALATAGTAYDVSALDALAKDDVVLTQYATLAFAYTGSEATAQTIQGAGQSSYGQGQASQQSAVGTYTYTYSGNAKGYLTGMNVWNNLTGITLPNGNQESVYTNIFGEVMLSDLTDTTDSSTTGNAALAGSNWYTFTRLDPAGRILFTANPSAFLTVQPDPKQVDLVAAQAGGSFNDISGSSGLIDYTDYYGSTDIAPGFVKDTAISNGIGGQKIYQSYFQYSTQSTGGSGGPSIHPLSSIKVFANNATSLTDPSAQTTTYTPTFNGGSFHMTAMRITYPVVSSAQNGTGTASYVIKNFDGFGRTQSRQVFDDVANHTYETDFKYDNATDVATSVYQVSTNITTGESVDVFGRPTAITNANQMITTLSYVDTLAMESVTVLPPIGPSVVTSVNRAKGFTDTLTQAGNSNKSLTRTFTDFAGRTVATDRYAIVPGNYDPMQSGTFGKTQNIDYYESQERYDTGGRLNWTQNAVGTITETTFDGLDRPYTVSIGVGGNMTPVSQDQYDNNSVGDGNLTQTTLFPGAGQPNRVTNLNYDWRDRAVSSDNTISRTTKTLDNLDEITSAKIYDDSNGNMVAWTDNSIDARGRVYQTIQHSVDPTTGVSDGPTLTTNLYYDGRGNLVAESDPGGLWTKSAYDGSGRKIDVYYTDGSGTAFNAASGNVISHQNFTYDAVGNLVLTISMDFGNGTSRTTYVAQYYDAANRLIGTADFGTTAVSAPAVGATPPARTVGGPHVTTYNYDVAGNVHDITDPNGIVTDRQFDALGRVTAEFDNSVPAGVETASQNKTVRYTYDGLNHIITAIADVASPGKSTGQQTTHYYYGFVSGTNNSAISDNDLLLSVQYPDHHLESYGYDALGDVIQHTDSSLDLHVYSYDAQGRLTSDYVQTLGPGIDGSVRKLLYDYDALGRLTVATSQDANFHIVNQVTNSYNGFGQIASQSQDHGIGGVTASSPVIQYGYTYSQIGNYNRLTSITYPDGDVIDYGYSAIPLDDAISRVDSITDTRTAATGQTTEAYSYLGLGNIVGRTLTGSGVIQITALTSFGQVQSWNYLLGSNLVAGFAYTYNPDGTVNTVTDTKSGVVTTYGYDPLGRETSDSMGTVTITLSRNLQSNSTLSQTAANWSVDSLGSKSYGTSSQTGTAYQQYGSDGNVASLVYSSQNSSSVTFDAWGRLIAINSTANTKSTGNWTFAYDALGRRITSVNPTAGTSQSYYDGQNLIADDNAGRLVWSPDGQLVEEAGKFILTDAQNSTVALLDASGNVLERYIYNSDGRPTALDANYQPRFQTGGKDPGASQYNVQFLYQARRWLTLFYDQAIGGVWSGGGGVSMDSSGTWVNGFNGQQLTPAPHNYAEGNAGHVYNPGKVSLNGWFWSTVGVVDTTVETAAVIAGAIVLGPEIAIGAGVLALAYQGYQGYTEYGGIEGAIAKASGISTIYEGATNISWKDGTTELGLDSFDRASAITGGSIQLAATGYALYGIATSPLARGAVEGLGNLLTPGNWEYPAGYVTSNGLPMYRGPGWAAKVAALRDIQDFYENEYADEFTRDSVIPERYLNPANRPAYAEGQVEAVWKNALQEGNGRVVDPFTGEELSWNYGLPRDGQWDMGHIQSYSSQHTKLLNGEMTWGEFMDWYQDPASYRPQSIPSNRGRLGGI
jgi:YD repeat-containing protein